MKRFWLILLSLGLVMAFSASAFAVDVQFSGSYFAAGMYLDQVSLVKGNTYISKYTGGVPTIATNMDNESTAFYYQRLRVRTDFTVSPGLKLITRFDALERIWGGPRSNPTGGLNINGYPSTSWPNAGTRAETENISFDWAYIEYASPIGLFKVGYMDDGPTGTLFGNSIIGGRGRIRYYYTAGPVTIAADITKVQDSSYSAVNTGATYTDADADKYGLEGIYQWNAGRAGMKVTYYNYDQNRPAIAPASNPLAAGNYATKYTVFTPYFIAKTGPVDIQAQVYYAVGQAKTYDSGIVGKDIRLDNLMAFIDATATFGPIYFGGTFAYISGDNPGTTDRQEGGTLNGGQDWNPCLIMFNYYDRTYWVGALQGNDALTNSGPMSNAWFYQVNAGVRPTPALDIKASVAYAYADQPSANVPVGYASDKSYGWELDVTGTYKITNNLSYMLGVGYWWVGDFYKGLASEQNKVRDDYMIINKLTLTF
jgi:hypothetical protein